LLFDDLIQKKLGIPEEEFTELQPSLKMGSLEKVIQRHGGVTEEYSGHGKVENSRPMTIDPGAENAGENL
jgi:hypothetical protein